MTKDENSQKFANQNKTSSKDPRENQGSVGMEAQRHQPQPKSNKKDN